MFLDVDARPTEAGDLKALTVTAAELNGTVFLEREIAAAAAARATLHRTLALAGEEAAIAPHDHFGIPADLPATITARGSEPLVLLDATLR